MMKEEFLQQLYNDEEYIQNREEEQKEYMAYYKDIHRVEDALIPMLFQQLILMHIERKPEMKGKYEMAMDILQARIDKAFSGVSNDIKIRNRAIRMAKKITKYFIDEKFDSRKGFLTLMSWVEALEKAGGIIIDGDFQVFIDDMNEIIQRGYQEIDNFDKIDLSAINHVGKIHKLTQEEGYF